jgi:hypothetical protein
MKRRILRGAALFAVSGAVTYAFLLNLCHAIYRCGCRSWWSGADELCNVHQPDARHCPWCSYGDAGAALMLALILAPQFALAFWPAALPMRWRAPLMLALFPVAGALVGLGYGWHAGYWR